MLNWQKISLLLCCFGFLREIRPSEPFVSDFLIEPWRNVTMEQLNKYVYPLGTYATAFQLIIVFLITDFLRYKPVVIMIGVAGIITWSLLLWTTSLLGTQIIQIFYGTYMATEVAYFTYIYAKVPKQHYLAVTVHTRAALLIGKFFSSTLSQTLIYTKIMNIRELNYITLTAQTLATILACCLPSVERSLYFNNDEETEHKTEQPKYLEKCKSAFKLIYSHFTQAYSNRVVLIWSLWYAFGLCGFFQVITYIQMLWSSIDNNPDHIWNGAVDAIATLVCAGIAMLANRLHENVLNTKIKILFVLVIMSLLQSCAIFVLTNLGNRFISYGGFTVFYMLYTFTITISSAEIAKRLPDDSYGLIFGLNTFGAILMQTILTVIVVTDTVGFNLNIFQQFNVYSVYFSLLALLYFIFILNSVFTK